MTSKLASAVTGKVVQRLNGPKGVNSHIVTLAPALDGAWVNPDQVRPENVSAELADRSNTMQYPAMQVYCEKLVNSLTEKFRSFSGCAQVAVEVRHSLDRLAGLQDGLEVCTDAVLQVLHSSRGDWGDGMFFGGEYQVAFSAVKHGGKNFMQAAKITFEIGVSRSV